MKNIDVMINHQKVGELFFQKEKNDYGFNYLKEISPISLIMPYRQSSYIWHNKLHPIFEMNMPEGYLFELFKNLLSKEHGYINDFLIFSYLSSNIQGRLQFVSPIEKSDYQSIDINEVIKNDSDDTFARILNTFLTKNAISGVQPKTLALLEDKTSFTTKEYIIKTWGNEFPQLALNEYFCLNAVQKAGVEIVTIQLSSHHKFLLVERFNYNKNRDEYVGFEEVLVLFGKNKDEKYSGSYEAIAKLIYTVTEDKQQSMQTLFKTIVMNYLLKNGDAHLKNFGVIYDSSSQTIENIRLSPAYDIVNTCVYMYKDRPALTMFGKKMWFGKNELIKFGKKHCFLSQQMSKQLYEECINALTESIKELELYIGSNIRSNMKFKLIGQKMLDSWLYSLHQTTHKELPIEIIRHWKDNKNTQKR